MSSTTGNLCPECRSTSMSWLLFAARLGVNAVAARDSRAVELRADELAARAAGTDAACTCST